MHHRGFFVDGLSQIFAVDNFDQPDAGGTELMIKRIAVRFLDDNFDFIPVRSGSCRMNWGLSRVRIPASPTASLPRLAGNQRGYPPAASTFP